MNIEIVELKKDDIEKYNVEHFLFKMIKESYDLDYVPEFHYDVKGLEEYYIKPERNNFLIALFNDNIVASAGIRAYDKNYDFIDRTYTDKTTASLYRVFVDSEYRHRKIASNMIKEIEKFCVEKQYDEIYLHTQEDSYGALPFWLNQDFKIFKEEDDEYGTIHMEKKLKNKELV